MNTQALHSTNTPCSSKNNKFITDRLIVSPILFHQVIIYQIILISILAVLFSNTSLAMGSLTKEAVNKVNDETILSTNSKGSTPASWIENISPIENCAVIATIRPIQLLVDQIRYGDNDDNNSVDNKSKQQTTTVVLEDNQDHHLSVLKPSQEKLIEKAHVVFYISDKFDAYIPKIKNNSKDTLFFPLGTIKNLRLLATRKSGAMPHSYHGDVNQTSQLQAIDAKYSSNATNNSNSNIQNFSNGHLNHAQHNRGIDWHIWLNPDNAILMMGKIKQVLSALEPHNSANFAANYQAAKMSIMQQTESITANLLKHMGTSFITLHDGYQYLEDQYGLYSDGTIYEKNAHLQPSLSHIQKLRQVTEQKNTRCVWKETQYSGRLINVVMGDSVHQVAHIDSLAQSNQMQSKSYTQFIEKITNEINNCLSH